MVVSLRDPNPVVNVRALVEVTRADGTSVIHEATRINVTSKPDHGVTWDIRFPEYEGEWPINLAETAPLIQGRAPTGFSMTVEGLLPPDEPGRPPNVTITRVPAKPKERPHV